MGKTINEKEFEEQAYKNKSKETAEALILARDIVKDLADKYKNFEVRPLKESKPSVGFFNKKSGAGGGGSYLSIEVSTLGRDLFLGRKTLQNIGIKDEMIDLANKYSGLLDLKRAVSKKEQVRLFFKYFEKIIEELDPKQKEYLEFFNKVAEGLKEKISGPIIIRPKPQFSCQQVLFKDMPEYTHFEWQFRGSSPKKLLVGLHSEKWRDQNYNKKIIEESLVFKDKIEEKTEEKLIEDPPDKIQTKIYVEKEVDGLDGELRDWAVEKMKSFIDVLRPELNKISGSILNENKIIKIAQKRNDEGNSVVNTINKGEHEINKKNMIAYILFAALVLSAVATLINNNLSFVLYLILFFWGLFLVYLLLDWGSQGIAEKEKEEKMRRARKFLEYIENIKTTGEIPEVESPIFLNENEKAYLVEESSGLAEVKSIRNSKGAFVSASVVRGLRVGGYRGQSESNSEWRMVDAGKTVLTNKRMVYVGNHKKVSIPIDKLLSFKFVDGYMEVVCDNRRNNIKLFFPDPILWKLVVGIIKKFPDLKKIPKNFDERINYLNVEKN